MQKLLDGIRRFHEEIFPARRAAFERLAAGQHPLALFITCSDSRIDPSLVTQTEPGELFVLRTAGNIVPPYDAPQAGEAATIEYAVSALGVPDIIVCGHSQCGAVTGLLNPDAIGPMPAVESLLKHAEEVRRFVPETHSDGNDSHRLDRAIEANVLLGLNRLQTHPAVSGALSENRLRLHGWVYRFESGDILAFDPDSGEFQPLLKDPPRAA